MILLQELNLNYKWNPIYWQTANLIVDSGSLDNNSNDSTDYGKIGIAIANIKKDTFDLDKKYLDMFEKAKKCNYEDETIGII